MNNRDTVLCWIQAVASACDISLPTSPDLQKKRKIDAENCQQLTSPPSSIIMASTPQNKRQKTTNVFTGSFDIDLTPRAAPGTLPSPDRVSASSGSRASSVYSNQDSLKIQWMNLGLDEQGIVKRQLEVDQLPQRASELVNTFEDISRGLDILPFDQRDILGVGNAHTWRYSFKPSSEEDCLPGHIPLPSEIASVCAHAKECHNMGYDEFGWNMEVHHRLLQSVLRHQESHNKLPFNFLSWYVPL